MCTAAIICAAMFACAGFTLNVSASLEEALFALNTSAPLEESFFTLNVPAPLEEAFAAETPGQESEATETTASGPQTSETYAIPLLMIVVGFDGGADPEAAAAYNNDYDWNASLFGASDTPASYYQDMSNGLFTFAPAPETSASGVDGNTNVADRVNDGIVHVNLHLPHSAWGPVNVDDNVARDFAEMVMDAVRSTTQYVDYASFDTNGNGSLDQQELTICICVAGYEASNITDYRRTDVPLTWSHSGMLTSLDRDSRSVDDIKFESYIAIAEQYFEYGDSLEGVEQEPLGVLYHELGHALGLPDLYAVSITEGPWEDYHVGPLSLMDDGGWQYYNDGADERNIPSSLDAWSRFVLGWIQPQIAATSGDYIVSSQYSDAGYSTLLIPTNNPDEYFIVENRQAEGHDISLTGADLPNGGIVIWHVENGVYANYYNQNQVNDANHHPAVMEVDLADVEPNALLLYNQNNDVPEAQAQAGITVQFDGIPARDMLIHVELNDAEGALNAIHPFDDVALNQLRMTEPPTAFEEVTAVLKAATRH